ncbi:class I SAM-dependent methyltransferase, partial [Haemophilus influenzae]
MTNELTFNSDWFTHNVPALEAIMADLKPSKILEIGSFEGRSTVFFLENMLNIHDKVEIHCIDSWLGGREHIQSGWDMDSVEHQFEENIRTFLHSFNEKKECKVVKRKGYSHAKMIELLTQGYENYFDFIYVDGLHEATDVLFDALLAHRLVRGGGIIAFDDYLWSPDPLGQQDHFNLVKPAVDAYVNIYQRKVA